MLLHFSKNICLYIRPSSMQIQFQLLPIILVVTDVEVSQATVSSVAEWSSSSTSESSSSGNFSFLSFSRFIMIYIRRNSIILVIYFTFLYRRLLFYSPWFFSSRLVNFVFLVFLLLTSLSYFYIRLSCLFTFGYIVLSHL